MKSISLKQFMKLHGEKPLPPYQVEFLDATDGLLAKLHVNRALRPKENPVDDFDRLTKAGFKLNLITGEWTR